ncbi:flavodoxin family protein [Haloglycomyces albus]|uniref:flavodoxin family protein n=1 Tax=Haloglycomyces albus TaxID=526067 RepID=UPI00046CC057|nr:NAD(P)H-dependent oxidoreductase [Haloglycomyces albus]
MDNSQRRFLFILGSARDERNESNTEILTRQAAQQLPEGTEQEWIRLTDYPLDPFRDRSDSGDTPTFPKGNEKALLDATLAATDLVIASPLYWYGVSSYTQAYLEYWDKWFLIPELNFEERMKGRNLWGVTAMGVKQTEHSDPLRDKLSLTAEFMSMEWKGFLVATSGGSGQIRKREEAMVKAKEFFA